MNDHGLYFYGLIMRGSFTTYILVIYNILCYKYYLVITVISLPLFVLAIKYSAVKEPLIDNLS